MLMISQFQKRKRTAFSAGTFWTALAVIIILMITGFLIFSNIKIKQKRDKLNAQIALIEKEIEDIQNKNEGLKEGISSVGDEDYIEKVAREELNLQKEGEKVVGFILPPQQEETREEKNFWQPSYWRQWLEEKWQWIKSKF